jgi:dihydroxyacetone kinase
MSALNLPGVSLTLVLLPRSPVNTSFETSLVFDAKLVIDSLDAPTEAPSWPWHFKGRPVAHLEEKSVDSKDEASTKKSTITLARSFLFLPRIAIKVIS